MMIGAVYDALVEAGASPEKSRQAAEAIASYEGGVSRVEQDVTERTGDLRGDFASLRREIDTRLSAIEVQFIKVESESKLVRWMLGFVLATNVALLVKIFFP